jgi:hypothetical protein
MVRVDDRGCRSEGEEEMKVKSGRKRVLEVKHKRDLATGNRALAKRGALTQLKGLLQKFSCLMLKKM